MTRKSACILCVLVILLIIQYIRSNVKYGRLRAKLTQEQEFTNAIMDEFGISWIKLKEGVRVNR